MKAAITDVFVRLVHRNCHLHIMENARKTMGAFLDSKEDGKQELADDFKDCIDNSFMPEEFEQKWQAFLDKYGINGDERFQHLYDLDIVGSRRISCIVSSPSSK